jgi:predicted DNA-binding transcriptional regulator AlpA
MAMKPRRIVRNKEAYLRLGVGHTKFHEDYVLRDPADPFVPGTRIPRLRRIPIGVRNVGFLDHEIDQLIEAFGKLGDADVALVRERPTRVETKFIRRPAATARDR